MQSHQQRVIARHLSHGLFSFRYAAEMVRCCLFDNLALSTWRSRRIRSMRKPGLAEMNAFVAIAERSSFAKAAGHLGISRSTLSETIRGLEEKLGVRLLNRTTRSVALTVVGEHLLAELRPALDNLAAGGESISVFRDEPAGHLRLTVPRPAAKTVIEPIL